MYTEISLTFDRANAPECSEIAIALLGSIEFESFQENDLGLQAYVQSSLFQEEALEDVLAQLQNITPIKIERKDIPKENWNQKWEDSYEPIEIAEKCVVLAHFHKDIYPNTYIKLHIDPKMSFGTGHHETTRLMIENILSLDFTNKNVIDIGCGTGVLGILTKILGAKHVFGIDIDEWSIENTYENVVKNNLNPTDFTIKQCILKDFTHSVLYDYVLANINKNTILSDILAYIAICAPKATILLSGFYTHDVQDILHVLPNNVHFVSQISSNSWCSIVVQKS